MSYFTAITLNVVLMMTSTTISAFTLSAEPLTSRTSSWQHITTTPSYNGIRTHLASTKSMDDAPWPYIREPKISDFPFNFDEHKKSELDAIFIQNGVEIKIQLDTTPPLPDTNDPFIILDVSPSDNKKTVKSAYKRLALMYHPDARIKSNSSEKLRKKANDEFARINNAYMSIRKKERLKQKMKRNKSSDSYWSVSPGGGFGYDWVS